LNKAQRKKKIGIGADFLVASRAIRTIEISLVEFKSRATMDQLLEIRDPGLILSVGLRPMALSRTNIDVWEWGVRPQNVLLCAQIILDPAAVEAR